ncbi:MAG: hypothetical protein K0V04_09525 [Deltaproteobacteria bacterium]|nr:hypothetical protein [Deltaproteobacteria bacterium]
MTGEKNSRWTDLRTTPVVMYMSGAFRSALVPVANLQRLFNRRSYTATTLATPWSERRHASNWVKRSGAKVSPFVRLEPRRGELVRQCARAFAMEGKWDHLALLGTVAPMILLGDGDESEEIDPSIYVMY